MRILRTLFTVGILFAAANAYAGETHSLLFGEPGPPPMTGQGVGLEDPEASTPDAVQPKTSILEADFPLFQENEQDEEAVQETEPTADASCVSPCHAPCAAPCRHVWRCANYMPRHCFRSCGPCAPVAASACAPAAKQYRKITKEITYEVKVPYQERCTRTYVVDVPRWAMRPTQVAQRVYTPAACVPAACAPSVPACEAAAEAEMAEETDAETVVADCLIRTHTVMKPFCTMVPQERTQQYTVWKWRTETRKCIVEEIVCN